MTEPVGVPQPGDRVLHELRAVGRGERFLRVVVGQLPRFGNQVGRAHRSSLSGTQTEIAAGLTRNLSRFVLERSPPSSSYGILASSSTTIFSAVVVCTKGEDAVCPTAVFAEHACPVEEPVGGDDPDVQPAVVGTSLGERGDAADDVAHVAHEHGAGRTLEPAPAIHLNSCTDGLVPGGLDARDDVPEPPEPVFQAAVRLADHQRVDPRSRHDREPLAVHNPHVEGLTLPCEPDADGLLEVVRDAEVRREQVRGARGEDREGHRRVPDRIDATLDHAVAAPDEEQVDAVFEELRHFLRRELALRDLAPERSVDAVLFQRVPQRAQAAAELLPGMRDHADGGHQAASSAAARRSRSTVPSRSSDTATALLVASSANSNAPHPSSTLARTSVR